MKTRSLRLAVAALVAAAVLCVAAVGHAAVGTPAVTISLNTSTVLSSSDVVNTVGEEAAFTVPYPQRATIQWQVTSQPPGLTYRMYFYPVGICPSLQYRVGQYCYPSDGWDSSFEFTEQVLRDNGSSWKARVTVSGPAGRYQLSGGTIVTDLRTGEIMPPELPDEDFEDVNPAESVYSIADTSKITLKSANTAKSPPYYTYEFYKNAAYRCSGNGYHTFLVLNPPQKAQSELPLITYIPGGGVSSWIEGGVLDPEWNRLWYIQENNFKLLYSHLTGRTHPTDPEIVWPPPGGLAENIINSQQYRILILSACENDAFGGVGALDVYNPNGETVGTADRPRKDGLLAGLSAIKYVTEKYKTTKEFAWGCSAGSIGSFNFAKAYELSNRKFDGIVSDSGADNMVFQEMYDDGCLTRAAGNPSVWRSQIGEWLQDGHLGWQEIQRGVINRSPFYVIWSPKDDVYCGQADRVFDVYRDVIEQKNPGGDSVARRVCTTFDGVTCNVHCPTLSLGKPEPGSPDQNLNDEIFAWLESIRTK